MTWGARKVRYSLIWISTCLTTQLYCSLHLKNQSHSHRLICWLHGPERQGKEFVFIGHLKPCT